MLKVDLKVLSKKMPNTASFFSVMKKGIVLYNARQASVCVRGLSVFHISYS